jgi:8-oxo-dGTP diphosphatase
VAVAIAGCRRDRDGSLEWLLIQRAKAPSIGQWSLPGGSVELGEGSLQAAKRELSEETGISGEKVKNVRLSAIDQSCKEKLS